MSRIAYVNGLYVPHHEAAVHIEDRGYQFADGVYEVIAVCAGRLLDGEAHFERLEHSLKEIGISRPMERRALKVVVREMIRRNRLSHGFIYLQVTRGVSRRSHFFPEDTASSLVMTARRSRPLGEQEERPGVNVITMPDIRWKRCDIKSISLLPNIIAKQRAKEEGAFDAWLVDGEGMITEGAASNAWIVTVSGELLTRDAGGAVLNGVTRRAILELAQGEGITFAERPFTVEEAKAAAEAFLTSTTSAIKPVLSIDGEAIGGGRPGPFYSKLAALYARHIINGEGGE